MQAMPFPNSKLIIFIIQSHNFDVELLIIMTGDLEGSGSGSHSAEHPQHGRQPFRGSVALEATGGGFLGSARTGCPAGYSDLSFL